MVLERLRQDYNRLNKRQNVTSTCLTTTPADGDAVKARVRSVHKGLSTSERAAARSRKAFEDGYQQELDKSQEWIANRFARIADASEKVVSDSLRGLEEPR